MSLPPLLRRQLMETVELYGLCEEGVEALRELLSRARGERAPAERYVEPVLVDRGGMGEVFLVRDTATGQELVRKTPIEGEDWGRFLREARITARLHHPGVSPVHDIGQLPDGRPFYVMREVRGTRMDRAMEAARSAGRPALRRLVEALIRVSDTLALAHGEGIVHRDLKPQNIMLGEHGEVVVLDWGLAHVAGDASLDLGPERLIAEATRAGLGTPGYMSPEQARGGMVSPSADIWSLGAILHLLLTGRPPPNEALEAPPPLPRAARPLGSLVQAALDPDPSRRPDAVALGRGLQAWLDDEPVAGHRPDLAERLDRLLRRWRIPLAVASIGLLLLSLAGGAWWAERARADSIEHGARAGRLSEQSLARLDLLDPISASLMALEAERLLGRRDPALEGVLVAASSEWTPRLLGRFAVGNGCHQVAWSPDGAWVACGVQAVEGDTVAQWLIPTAGGAPIQIDLDGRTTNALAWSPDGQALAVFADDGRLWAFNAGSWDRSQVGEARQDVAGTLFQDAHTLLVGFEDGSLEAWSWPEGAPIERFTAPGLTLVRALTRSPDGWIYAATGERRLDRWRPEVGFEGPVVLGQDADVFALSPTGQRLVAGGYPLGGDGRIRAWVIGDPTPQVESPPMQGAITALTWSPDGRLVAVGGRSPWVELLDGETLQPRLRIPLMARSGADYVRALSFAPDDRLLVALRQGDLRIWEIPDAPQPPLHQPYLRSAAFAEGDRRVATCDKDATLRIWDPRDWRLVDTVALGPNHNCQLAGDPTSPDFMVAWRGGFAFWTEGQGIRCKGSIGGERGIPYGIARDPRGDRALIYGQRSQGVGLGILVDTRTCKLVDEVEVFGSSTLGGAFLASGEVLLSAANGELWRWPSPASPSLLPGLGTTNPRGAIATLEGDRSFAVGHRVDQGIELRGPPAYTPDRVLLGHTDWALLLANLGDHGRLASASWDQTIRIWDLKSGRTVAILPALQKPAISLAADPSGRWLSTVIDGQERPRIVDLSVLDEPRAELEARLKERWELGPTILGE